MPYQCDNGDGRKISITYTDADGVLADPTTVTLKVKDPNGVVTTPSPTNPSVGLYHATVYFNVSGRWYFQYITDSAFGVEEHDYVDVAASVFE